jgi:hypothetical protein
MAVRTARDFVLYRYNKQNFSQQFIYALKIPGFPRVGCHARAIKRSYFKALKKIAGGMRRFFPADKPGQPPFSRDHMA